MGVEGKNQYINSGLIYSEHPPPQPQVDGEEDTKAGLDLYEFAEIIVEQQLWEAVVCSCDCIVRSEELYCALLIR